MRLTMINKVNVILITFTLLLCSYSTAQKKSPFVVVIDAGHGGKDVGARGPVENENIIALDVALLLGEKIENVFKKDVKVVFTRKDDTFIELAERASVANRNNANLFISIHCNSAKNREATGSETFVMGLRRMKENIEVSQRENSVILLENDQERYQKFDPNDPEAVIAFEVMHSAYMEQSIRFAQLVENSFTNKGGLSRGVKQNIFHVLRGNASPSVLIELGFISNRYEGEYLASYEGKEDRAQSIFEAFEAYKKEYDKKNSTTSESVKEVKKKEIEKPIIGKVFKIQILASKSQYSPSSPNLKGLTNIDIMQTGDVYKYYYGNTNLVSERDELLAQAKKRGFTDAFVVEFESSKALNNEQNYKIHFLTTDKKYRTKDRMFNGLDDVIRIKTESLYRYFYGNDKTLDNAQKTLSFVKGKGFRSSFIVTFNGDKLIQN